MKVFLTGATGYVGGAVARALALAGHDIVALAHREGAEEELAAAGYATVAGDLTDPGALSMAARNAEAVVHAASTDGAEAAVVDEAATRAMVGALEGSDTPFLYTSGIWVIGETEGPAEEDTPLNPASVSAWREELEAWLVGAADRGVRTVVIRPGILYGRKGGIPAMMARGELPVIGDGDNRWPLIHAGDVGRLYAAALERAPAGSILHGVAEHVKMRDLGARLGAGTISYDEALERFGGLAEALVLDQVIDSTWTRGLLHWRPQEPGVLEVPVSELG